LRKNKDTFGAEVGSDELQTGRCRCCPDGFSLYRWSAPGRDKGNRHGYPQADFIGQITLFTRKNG